MATTTQPRTLSSSDVCERVGITYRQLDHFARTHLEERAPATLSRGGSGNARRWPLDIVARLELAGRLAAAAGVDWGTMAREVYDAEGDLPSAGWVLLDELHRVHFAEDVDGIAELLTTTSGGLVARYDVDPID